MSWLFSQALVAGFLEENSLGGRLFAPLSENNTQQAYLCNVKTKGSFRLSRYGMMFRPLTEDLGKDLLMWFRADSLVKISPLQEQTEEAEVVELTEKSLDFGLNLKGSLAKLHPDGYWLRTPITLEPKVLEEFSKIWPSSGIMLHGECYQQQTVMPTTNGSECGLLPTPTTIGNQLAPSMMKRKGCRELKNFLRKLPTPTAHNAKEGGYPAEGTRNTPTLGWEIGGKIPPTLTEWMMGWPIGWTDLKLLEMDKFQSWQQQHSFN